MNLILFGFKGCGKSYFGKKIAALLSYPFYDLDALMLDLYVERSQEKHTISSLYRTLGEKEFRLLESEALFSLQKTQCSIISLGGGTVLSPQNVLFLQELGTLIYLKASFTRIRERISHIENGFAPLDGQDFETSFEKLYRERLFLYASIPALSIDTDLLDEAGVLAKLRSLVLDCN